jgi:hypothetical protein
MKDIRVPERPRAGLRGEWIAYIILAALLSAGVALRLLAGSATRVNQGSGFSLRLPAVLSASTSLKSEPRQFGPATIEDLARWDARLAGLPVREMRVSVLRSFDKAYAFAGPAVLLSMARSYSERQYALSTTASVEPAEGMKAFLMIGSCLDERRGTEIQRVTCLIDYVYPRQDGAMVLSFTADPDKLDSALAFASRTAASFVPVEGGAR